MQPPKGAKSIKNHSIEYEVINCRHDILSRHSINRFAIKMNRKIYLEL